VIDAKNVPYQLLDDISDSTEPRDHSVYCEKAWKLILPTLKKWSSEIKNLKVVKLMHGFTRSFFYFDTI
jgi:hypothetical protein